MNESIVALSSFDLQRLEPLLARSGAEADLPDYLAALSARLCDCEERPPAAVPSDVVTMNSRVRLLDLRSNRAISCTLVFPRAADSAEGRISVLAPLGAALFGARVGATITVDSPRGEQRFRIEELLYQPEAAGRYDL